jgi:hypothetical protein
VTVLIITLITIFFVAGAALGTYLRFTLLIAAILTSLADAASFLLNQGMSTPGQQG